MLKNSDQIVTSRLANVEGIAAIARITIKMMRTYSKWNLIFERKEISKTIAALENYFNLASGKILRSIFRKFIFEFERLFT